MSNFFSTEGFKRNIVVFYVGLVFLLLSPGGSKAAEDGVLSLREAIRIALENHPRIRGARETVGIGQAVLGQTLAAYYPSITFNNLYRSTTAAGATEVSQEAFDFFSSTANFDMILYNFGKREGAVQSAKYNLDATRHAFKGATDEVILAVKQAYYGYLQAKALLKVREDTVKAREILVRQAQDFFKAGTRPKIDVARAESNLHSARADLVAAQNGVKIAWLTLRNALGVRDLPERPLTEELTIIRTPISLEKAEEVALLTRPELRQIESQRKGQDAQIATARREYLPDILFNSSYGRRNTSRNGNTFPLEPVWTAQVSLNIPIFTGFNTTYKVEEALRKYNLIKEQEEEKRQQITLELEQSYLKVIEAEERIKATEAAVRAAKENLDLASGRYRTGVGSIIEITEAQVLHADVQANHIRSIYDYRIAEAQLSKAMGTPEGDSP